MMSARPAGSPYAPTPRKADHAELRHAIEHAAHLLPAQGPIKVFIHHNTLHAFEDLAFDEAVQRGGRVFGCQPYLSETRYREELASGRIRFSELQEVMREELGARADEPILRLATRLEILQAMLQYPFRTGPTVELVWFVAETDALRHICPEASAAVRAGLVAETRRWVMRDLRLARESLRNLPSAKELRNGDALAALLDRCGPFTLENWSSQQWEAFTLQALWRICCDGARGVPATPIPFPGSARHRDLLLQVGEEDADLLVHDVLIRLCPAFLDQGVAMWQMPRREEGLFRAFLRLYQARGGPPARWMSGLAAELTRLDTQGSTPLQSIQESLTLLGVSKEEWDPFLTTTLLALRGWGGMLYQVETRADRVAHPIPEGSLVEFLAVRLILERFALAFVARDTLGYTGPLSGLRDECRRRQGPRAQPSVEQRAFGVFQLAQVLGWVPDVLHDLAPHDWSLLFGAIEQFSEMERRRVFHLAYERRFRNRALDALSIHARQLPALTPTPQFQLLCCLDEREESFRRHVEELAPQVETFGAAGFYNMAMYYRGAADAHFVPLCPVVIRPRNWVTEEVAKRQGEQHERRTRTRRRLGQAWLQFHAGSRTFAGGALLSAAVGWLASIPLVAQILFPRLTARIRRHVGRIVQTPPETSLCLEHRHDKAPAREGQLGFTLEELANAAEGLLRDTGLTRRFARLVLILGHGSSSLNNPHKSAYDCGACGGAVGGPNARAAAQVLNDPRVRSLLRLRGLDLPDDTVFVGGLHNTCNDQITLFDLDRVPESHREELAAVRHLLERACPRNAHERCRRFLAAPLSLTYDEAHAHVEERSEDLAQVRPELGHATNALCIVGRRLRTRGLFLDRRGFLVSYDPTQDDDDGTILTRILQAVFPVCAGINLEYYFSHVDSPGFGCGSKLPHNITALLGVMDGAASDLRTGLPWQMVEMHEAIRLLIVLETTPAKVRAILERNPPIHQLCHNGWVQLATLSPESGEVRVYRAGEFVEYCPQVEELPQAPNSTEWYRGWRDHLEFAQIGPRPNRVQA